VISCRIGQRQIQADLLTPLAPTAPLLPARHNVLAAILARIDQKKATEHRHRRYNMPRKPEEICCPRNPDHGKAVKRWLRGEYQQGGSGDNAPIADVFEIDCQTCGKYEYREDRSRNLDAAEQSVLKLRRS
jgi:hypothetical protein